MHQNHWVQAIAVLLALALALYQPPVGLNPYNRSGDSNPVPILIKEKCQNGTDDGYYRL